MLTRTVRTKNGESIRTAVDAQPFPKIIPRTDRQEKLLNLSDAHVAVRWLNAAKENGKTKSYERAVSIRQQLVDLRALRTRLQRFRNDSRGQKTAFRKLEAQRMLVKRGEKGRQVRFPAIDTRSPAYKALYRETERLHSLVNEALCRYGFRPRVTYFVAGDDWRGGMVPDDNSRWFVLKINNQTTVSEADAVLSLVRLDLVGEITKVRLCDVCKGCWIAARKSDQHCCSERCRIAFHVAKPDYHYRKAKKQREYRKSQKLRDESAKRLSRAQTSPHNARNVVSAP